MRVTKQLLVAIDFHSIYLFICIYFIIIIFIIIVVVVVVPLTLKVNGDQGPVPLAG